MAETKAITTAPVRQLPKLDDLYSDETLDALETSAELAVLLNAEPNPKWIKVQDGIPYLPVDRVKWLLSRIFVEWQWEVRHSMQLWNGVAVAGRIHYRHPSGEWRFTDGVGAAPVQFKKDTSPLPENLNQKSLQKAYPSAESFALKNAAKKLGKLFGARLSQNDEFDYGLVLDRFDALPISPDEQAVLNESIAASGIDESALAEFLGHPLQGLPKGLLSKANSRIISYQSHNAK